MGLAKLENNSGSVQQAAEKRRVDQEHACGPPRDAKEREIARSSTFLFRVAPY